MSIKLEVEHSAIGCLKFSSTSGTSHLTTTSHALVFHSSMHGSSISIPDNMEGEGATMSEDFALS